MSDGQTVQQAPFSHIFGPITGVLYFLFRPFLWFAPILTAVFACVVSLALSCLVLWLNWPVDAALGFWASSFAVSVACAYAILTFVILWVLAIPFVMGYAFESLARRIIQQRQRQNQEGDGSHTSEPVVAAMVSSSKIFLRSLPWRLLWLSLGLMCTFVFPPLSIFVSAIALGHICILDSSEIVLQLLGHDGETRQNFYKQQRLSLLAAGCVAGAISLVLASTIIGLLFWLPGMVCAAALTIPRLLPAATKRDIQDQGVRRC